jgi:predicted aldo/keto reductase-like oxidoreductase
MTLSRRTLLAGIAALPALGAEKDPQVPRRKLGKTGREIPILLMGTAMRLDPRFDPKLAEGLRFGVSYFDTADCYGSEPAIGSFLERTGARREVWITTKSDRWDPDGMRGNLETSLERMKTDHVDLFFMHQLDDPSRIDSENARCAEQLKKEGKIKAFGFSCHSGNVVELLNKAAGASFIDAIMFRYNFRSYGNRELNAAIDACAKANIGLIAMKTQGAEMADAAAPARFEQTGKWNKFQATLKAVWSDARMSAAVSHMDNFEKLKQNVAAALDKHELGLLERDSLEKYAQATRALACDGCDHICNPSVSAPVKIGATLRCLMYHDVYGQPEEAHRVFRSLPSEAQRLAGVDFTPANRACPHGVDVARHLERAKEVFGA